MAAKPVDFHQDKARTYVFLKQFEDVKEYPLSDSLCLVVCIVIAYLYFVLKLGPQFMKDREPYKLKYTILTYNAFQVMLSAYFVYLSYEIMTLTGFLPKTCSDRDLNVRNKMSYCVYVYWLGKITELLDTIFFTLRKKYSQVTFLHVYHHASVVFFTYLLFLYAQGSTVNLFIFCNSFVHVVMYLYYGLSGLGPGVAKYLTWKKHITNLQRVQFVVVFIYQLVNFLYTTCEHSVLGFLYFEISLVLFFYLFTNFYKSSYETKAKK
ncbi:hypothetical protein evm_008771 [Chilo suppressalis]|nr:hypothetical protein evm_008771 [Chilo suppressalis]